MTDLHATGPAPGWEPGEALELLREEFPGGILREERFRGQTTIVVPRERALEMLAWLRDAEGCSFDFLTDVTAVHWPARERPFDVVWHLYSFPRNVRLRVRTELAADEEAPSVVELWPAAGWLERECYDMFGIRFAGHPDLRRILMPEDFEGWPLRKEFPLKC